MHAAADLEILTEDDALLGRVWSRETAIVPATLSSATLDAAFARPVRRFEDAFDCDPRLRVCLLRDGLLGTIAFGELRASDSGSSSIAACGRFATKHAPAPAIKWYQVNLGRSENVWRVTSVYIIAES